MMSHLERSATVAQIVVEHAVAARIFQKYKIDFCCHGEITVPDACRPRQLDPEVVFAELEAIVAGGSCDDREDLRALSTVALIARIIDRHHEYLRRALPYIAPLAEKVAKVHGEHNQKLVPLRETFDALANALLPHLDQEEAVLFPALMRRPPEASVIRDELDAMYEDHVAVGQLLARIRDLSDEFTVPPWGCNTYRVYMAELAALEDDILRHVHLENHVLLPRFATAGAPRAA